MGRRERRTNNPSLPSFLPSHRPASPHQGLSTSANTFPFIPASSSSSSSAFHESPSRLLNAAIRESTLLMKAKRKREGRPFPGLCYETSQTFYSVQSSVLAVVSSNFWNLPLLSLSARSFLPPVPASTVLSRSVACQAS